MCFVIHFQTSSPIQEQSYSLQVSSMYSPPMKENQQQNTSFIGSSSSPTVQFQPVQVHIHPIPNFACRNYQVFHYHIDVTYVLLDTSSHGVSSADSSDGSWLVLSADDALSDVSPELHSKTSIHRCSTVYASRDYVS